MVFGAANPGQVEIMRYRKYPPGMYTRRMTLRRWARPLSTTGWLE